MYVVFDASALVAFLRGEPGGDVVRKLLEDDKVDCLAHVANLSEVYYHVLRAADDSVAQQTMSRLAEAGLGFRNDIDAVFWQEVARYKDVVGRVALTDCFAIALANRIGATIVTSDHQEFEPVAAQGVCSVRFIR